MSKYHYNVNIIPAKQDFSIWVGVNVANKYDGAEGEFVREGTELWDAAIARARELCPSMQDCFCENWNGGEMVAEDPVQRFLGKDYKDKMAILKAAIKPLLTALDQTHMQLAVDHRCEYYLTAIPCGDLPEGIDTGNLLDATVALGDAQHLVAIID